MARTLIVSDRHNSFFTANNIRVGNQLPTEGNYVKGDIIVNIGESTATEAMWICVESGNPGVWEVVGAGAGAGVNTKLTSITNHVILESGESEVEIGIEGFNAGNDMMLVFKNGVNMVEGVDYEVQDGKIVSTGEVWNENGIEDYGMTFVVFKEVVEYNGDAEVKAENIADGSIGMDKLGEDVREAIEDASNVDLSGKQDKSDEGLVTTDKTIVGAINELFQDVDSGKNIIADAIDVDGITGDSTFAAMGEAIESKNTEISNLETELAGKVTPAGTAVASNVLTGKTFINSTGEIITGTMANNGTKTITPKASAQTLGAGYYDKITINGDADLVAGNIVSGKNIFGVTGSATASSLGGMNFATGASTPVKFNSGLYGIKVTGLSFKPSLVLAISETENYYGYIVNINGYQKVACSSTTSYNSYKYMDNPSDSDSFMGCYNDGFKVGVHGGSVYSNFRWYAFG